MGQSFRAKTRRAAWLMAGFCLIWQAGTCVEAGGLYVYTDAQGQAVLTDNLEQVPAEYRGRVRTVASGESPASGATTSGTDTMVRRSSASSGVLEDILAAVAQKVSSHPIKGLTPHQTAVVIVAGACGVMLLVLMVLSSNPAVRLLCKFLLVLVCVAAVYQMYVRNVPSAGGMAGSSQQVSEPATGNIMGQMKTKTEQSYRLQDERTTRQLDQAEQSTR